MLIQREEAVRIAEEFADEICELYQNRILAVYAIGSLGSDYYRPGQSDIDIALITDFTSDEEPNAVKRIDEIADVYWKRYQVPKGFGSIVFTTEQLYPPYDVEKELVLEILRLKLQSKLLWGDYDIEAIPFPTKQDIINDARHFQEWVDESKVKDPNFGITSVQMLVNSTLIALKRYLMIEHNIIEFNKFKVIGLYMNNNPPISNAEVFSFIADVLSGKERNIDETEFEKMIRWHDDLYQTINNLTIYAK